MATTTKKTGILGRMKEAVAGMFKSDPARKSPKRVEAGRKAATTAKVDKAAGATEKAVKAVAKKAAAPARKTARKRSGKGK